MGNLGNIFIPIPAQDLIPSAGHQLVLASSRPAANGWSDMADKRKACWTNIGSISRHRSLPVASSHHGVSRRCASTTFWIKSFGEQAFNGADMVNSTGLRLAKILAVCFGVQSLPRCSTCAMHATGVDLRRCSSGTRQGQDKHNAPARSLHRGCGRRAGGARSTLPSPHWRSSCT